MASTLDIEQPAALIGYLREQGHLRADEKPRITVLSGGVSNRTVLVKRSNGESWVLKQALVKLRVKADWFSDPERIHREALGLRWLVKLAPPGMTTPLVFEDHTHHLLAMQAVPQPHQNWKTMLLNGDLQREHVIEFAALLKSIHTNARARTNELKPLFGDAAFFESLRLEPYYSYSAQQVPAAKNFLNELIEETRSQRTTIVHGDYSPKNILIRNGHLILLDHEVIHWGDPAFDLGFALTHFLSKALHLPKQRAAFSDAAQLFWKSYEDASCEARAVRHTLACLLARVAGRSPLEYLTTDERRIQQAAVLKLLAETPVTIPTLIERFVACL